MGYDYDKDNVGEMTLALLYLGATGEKRRPDRGGAASVGRVVQEILYMTIPALVGRIGGSERRRQEPA